MTRIRGILPVIPTPLRDGEFDPVSFRALLDHMLPNVDGYALLGSTGEAPSMTTGERMRIAEQAIAMTPKEKTIVVGVTTTAIADAVELARHAEAHGAKGVLCAAPYYFENSPSGVLEFLREIDSAIGIDLVLYDNPAATKTPLEAGDVVRWAADLDHLRTVKLTDHALEKVPIWRDAGIDVIGGDDPIFFRYLAAGVDGVMMIAPAIFPVAFAEVWRRTRDGRLEEALAVFAREVLPVLHVFGIGDEIVTTKALLNEIGIFASAESRVPLMPVGPDRRALLRAAFDLASAATEARLAAPGGGSD
jgi:4-hydroxy-tetrahydrodipicolinate synthase